jgi:hypothetical protein
MAHEHSVYDNDKHFKINPVTRNIENTTGKVVLIQHDHDSERFTFEIPKTVEGHDMSKCNVVQIHYLNIEAATKTDAEGLYEVDDQEVGNIINQEGENEDVVVFSWLISRNATQYVGNLNFVVRFKCVEDDGTVTYEWSTAIHKGIAVSESIYNSEVVVAEYADVLEKWRASLFFNTDGVTEDIAMSGHKITDMGSPTNDTDAATKGYVDNALKNINVSGGDASDKVSKAGDIMAGQLDMNTNKIIGLGTPTDNTDAANKIYVDELTNALSDELTVEIATKFGWAKIWANASPESSFEESDIQIAEMANYDVIAIETSNGVYFLSTVVTGYQGIFFPFEYEDSGGTHYLVYGRKIQMDSSTQIDINNCLYSTMGSSAVSTNNSMLIPLNIYGAHKKGG